MRKSVSRQVGKSAGWQVAVGKLASRQIGMSAGRQGGRSVGRQVGRLVSRQVGRSAGGQVGKWGSWPRGRECGAIEEGSWPRVHELGVIHEGSLLRGRECSGICGGLAPEPRTWRNAREINWILTVELLGALLDVHLGVLVVLEIPRCNRVPPRAWPLLAGPGSPGGWLDRAAVCMGRSC